MSLDNFETDIFTFDTKVKRCLRQTLDDKCSNIGGRQVYFGFNQSMLRLLTPIEEVMTPAPTPTTPDFLSPGRAISLTLSKSDEENIRSIRGLSGIGVNRTRQFAQSDFDDDFIDDNEAVITVQSIPTTRQPDTTPNTTADTETSGLSLDMQSQRMIPDGVQTSRPSKEQNKLRPRKNNRKPKLAIGVKPAFVEQRNPVAGQRPEGLRLPTVRVPVDRDGSSDKKHRKLSAEIGKRSEARLGDIKVPAKSKLPPIDQARFPPIDKYHTRTTKKTSRKDTSMGSTNSPLSTQNDNSVKGHTGTRSIALPPISLNGTSGHKIQPAKVTRRLHIHDTQSVGETTTHGADFNSARQEKVRLPSITSSNGNVRDRELPVGGKDARKGRTAVKSAKSIYRK